MEAPPSDQPTTEENKTTPTEAPTSETTNAPPSEVTEPVETNEGIPIDSDVTAEDATEEKPPAGPFPEFDINEVVEALGFDDVFDYLEFKRAGFKNEEGTEGYKEMKSLGFKSKAEYEQSKAVNGSEEVKTIDNSEEEKATTTSDEQLPVGTEK